MTTLPKIPDGMIVVASASGPKDTMDRWTAAVADLGMTVQARIDHARDAARVGMALRPTEVAVFGSPKAGTPLMKIAQTIGIDLPLKALVWQDEAGKTWLAYNDPVWLAKRHGIGAEAGRTLMAMADALATASHQAIKG